MLNRNYLNTIVAASTVNSIKPLMKDQQGNILTGKADLNGPTMLSATLQPHKMGDTHSGSGASAYNGLFFSIGSGITSATIDDYALASNIDLTNFNIITGTNTLTTTDYNDTKRVMSQTWNYSGSTQIEINEIGLFYYWYAGTVSPFSNLELMLDRTVLDSPIIVNNGDTFTIALTIGGKATVTINS